MDAFPGLPLLRHKASFLPSVPQLPRGAQGAWLGVEGGPMGCDIPMLSPRCWDRAMRGGPGSRGPQITAALGPSLKVGTVGIIPLAFSLTTDLQTGEAKEETEARGHESIKREGEHGWEGSVTQTAVTAFCKEMGNRPGEGKGPT